MTSTLMARSSRFAKQRTRLLQGHRMKSCHHVRKDCASDRDVTLPPSGCTFVRQRTLICLHWCLCVKVQHVRTSITHHLHPFIDAFPSFPNSLLSRLVAHGWQSPSGAPFPSASGSLGDCVTVVRLLCCSTLASDATMFVCFMGSLVQRTDKTVFVSGAFARRHCCASV